MLYLVRRTSVSTPKKPCEEAYEIKIKNIERRCVDDPSKLPYEKDWLQYGENHRVEDGQITRDNGLRKVWVVDIEDIDAFVEKYGCVILWAEDEDGHRELEIYDDNRE